MHDLRQTSLPYLPPVHHHPTPRELVDTLERVLHDLRISVTDRCNFRCGYCMPRTSLTKITLFAARIALSFEEITRLSRLFVATVYEKYGSLAESRFYARI